MWGDGEWGESGMGMGAEDVGDGEAGGDEVPSKD